MLYVYAIQQRHSPPEMYLPAFHAATRCQSLITSIATPGSLAHRYGVVLQELRLELLRHNNHLLTLAVEQRDGTEHATGAVVLEGDESILGPSGNLDMLGLPGGNLGLGQAGDAAGQLPIGDDALGFAEGSPGSSIIQMTGWGQFDSLVSPSHIMPVIGRY